MTGTVSLQEGISALFTERRVVAARLEEIDRIIERVQDALGDALRTPSLNPKAHVERLKKPQEVAAPAAAPVPLQPSASRDQDRADAVLALLAGGPQSTKAIAERLKQDRRVTKMALQRMKKVGALLSIGHGPGTKWALPGYRQIGQIGRVAFRPAQARAAAIEPPATPANAGLVVARDNAIKRRLGSGAATYNDLLQALPFEGIPEDQRRQVLDSAIRRLKVKRQITELPNGKLALS